MSVSRRRFALVLALTSGVGSRTLTRILARTDLLGLSPEAFFALSPEALRESFGIQQAVAQRLAGQWTALSESVQQVETRLDQRGVRLVTIADAAYPARLESFEPDPPAALFLYGNGRLLNGHTFTVMASRQAPRAALEDIERATETGVLQGEFLIGGHNRVEYQRAAVVPLRWGAPRVLVLDRGLFSALGEDLSEEPFAAARLWRFKFDPMTDLVVSPFRPGAGFGPVRNKLRDTLVAALSDRLVFPWIAEGGNMERLATRAIAAGREVWVSDRMVQYRQFLELGAHIVPS